MHKKIQKMMFIYHIFPTTGDRYRLGLPNYTIISYIVGLSPFFQAVPKNML